MLDTEGELTTGGDIPARSSSDVAAIEPNPHAASSKTAVLDRKPTIDVIEQARQVVEGAESSKHYEDLFKEGKVDVLFAYKNPDAQFLAFTYLLNGHFNPRSEISHKQLAKVNIKLVAQKIGLTKEEIAIYKDQLKIAKQWLEVSKSLEDKREMRLRWQPSSEENELRLKELDEQIPNSEINTNSFIHTALFYPREAILLSPDLSDDIKIQVIQGLGITISGEYGNKVYQAIDQEEDTLLKDVYESATSDDIKRSIIETAIKRLGTDPNAIDIVPFADFEGKDIEKVFVASMGNRFTTRQLVEEKLAPMFFADKDPKVIGNAWESLINVTAGNGEKKFKRFHSDGYNYGTTCMNRDIFLNFVDNSDKLIPIVDMLAKYDFNYAPVETNRTSVAHETIFSEEYVNGLIKLAEDKDRFKQELDYLKKHYPRFTYEYRMEDLYNPVKGETENLVKDNPFTMAFERYERKSDASLETARRALSFLERVPEHWRDTYIRSAVLGIINHTGINISETSLTETMKIATTLILDPHVSQETFEIIATSYLKESLRPEARNIKTAFHFLKAHADKVVSYVNGEKVASSDHAWLKFIMSASDLYRYQLNGQDDEEKITLGNKDIDFAYRSLVRIESSELRDLASEQLVYAYTDVDYRDLERAREIAALVSDENIRKRCEEQIELEIEREAKGETSSWKKMEGVKRNSATNSQFLIDLLGFGTKEANDKARHTYRENVNINLSAATKEPSDETSKEFGAEKEKIKDSVGVSINMSWDSILQTLDTGRLISIWENKKEMSERNTSMEYHYATRRDEIERKLDNRAKGGARDPHPVYGAVWSPNGRDEFFGPAWRYGGCFVKLRTDGIKGRTTATYDDSFNGFNDYPMLWEDMVSAEAMLNLTQFGARHKYVETQILGGVTTDDIESINIPRLILEELEDKSGPEAVTRVLLKIEELKQRFPDIAINIIEEANAKKMLEMLPMFYGTDVLAHSGNEIRKHYETIAKK